MGKARFNIKPFTDRVDEATRTALLRLCPEKKVVLHFSAGKDSLACWLTLKEMDFEVIPVYKEFFPLEMYNKYFDYCEKLFGVKVEKIPFTQDFICWMETYTSEKTLETHMKMRQVDSICNRDHFDDAILQKYGCNIAIIGTKASDSLHRRVNFQMAGPYNAKKRTFCLSWKLAKNAPLDIIVDHNVALPSWYLWAGRSPSFIFDVEFWFLKRYYPQDYAKLVEIVPDLDVMVYAFEKSKKPRLLKPLKKILELKAAGYEFI